MVGRAKWICWAITLATIRKARRASPSWCAKTGTRELTRGKAQRGQLINWAALRLKPSQEN